MLFALLLSALCSSSSGVEIRSDVLPDAHRTALTQELQIRLSSRTIESLLVEERAVDRLVVVVERTNERWVVRLHAEIGELQVPMAALDFAESEEDWVQLAAFAIEGAARSYVPRAPSPPAALPITSLSTPEVQNVANVKRETPWGLWAGLDVASYVNARQWAPGLTAGSNYRARSRLALGLRVRADLQRQNQTDLRLWESNISASVSATVWRFGPTRAEVEGLLGLALLRAQRDVPAFRDFRALPSLGLGAALTHAFRGGWGWRLWAQGTVLPGRPAYEFDGDLEVRRGLFQVTGGIGVNVRFHEAN